MNAAFIQDKVPQHALEQNQGFGAVIHKNIGEAQWLQLDPAIRARFDVTLPAHQPLRFSGTMHWVFCSPVGGLVAMALQFLNMVPARNARNCPFDFTIGEKEQGLSKQRRYQWTHGKSFYFISTFDDTPGLHEEFSGGLGMWLRLREAGGDLWFVDQGYFLRFGNRRWTLPRWLTACRFELVHRSIDKERFQIVLRVSHFLFGTLFYQRGEFKSATLPM